MVPRQLASLSERQLPMTGLGAALVDDLIAYYVDWRDSAAAVSEAYQRWIGATKAERAGRFSAYGAALDHEEAAAATYSQAADDLSRWLARRGTRAPAPSGRA